MKVVNLDKFKNKTTVTLDDKQYEVRGMTVGMYLNDADLAGLDQIPKDDQRGQIEGMLTVIGKLSNIPREVLVEQDFTVLAALMKVSQGKDPDEKDEEPAKDGESQQGNA